MKRAVGIGVFFLVLLATSCNGQTKKETAAPSSPAKIVGGGCDGCELMFVGMPKNITAVDSSSAWNDNGQRLLVRGKILKLDGQTPAPNVIVYYWQTDSKGYYSGGQGATKRHGAIRGWVQSDAQGNYAIYTIRPGNYPNSEMPAHIHLSIKEPEIDDPYYSDGLVFDDDPKLTGAERKKLENRAGSGVLRILQDGELQVAEHTIILGLHIPNYPEKRQQKLPSGLEIGEDNPSFTPFHAWGPDKGSIACPVCKYGRYHGIVYFVGNHPNWSEIKKWLLYLEQESIMREKYLKAYFVYGNENGYSKAKRQLELEELGKTLQLEKIALTFVPSLVDTQSDVYLNKINPTAENTMIIYRNRNIIGKFIALKPTQENRTKVSEMLDRTTNEFFELPAAKH